MSDEELLNLATQAGRALASEGRSLVTAESCTGGRVAAAVTAVAGSSDWFDRGFVTYSNAAKQELLDVQSDTLAAHGAVSEPVAREMARGALARSPRAGVGVAVSGIAGPGGGSEHKPVGTVCIAWATVEGRCWSTTMHYEGDREGIRRQAVVDVLRGLVDLLAS